MDYIRNRELENRVCSADQAAALIRNGMTIVTSGFTPSGYPKVVPEALARRVENGEEIQITLITGASVGEQLDENLAKHGIIKRRFPYQTDTVVRNEINRGIIAFKDPHLSDLAQALDTDVYGKIDLAIVEALAIEHDGSIIPTTSVGVMPSGLRNAEAVIVEINKSQAAKLEGMHDIYTIEPLPNRKPIPLTNVFDRIGTTSIPCDPSKIIAIVFSDQPDNLRPLNPPDLVSQAISQHIIELLSREVELGRMPQNLFPIQSGVGSVANAVLSGLKKSGFSHLNCYSEVIQDSMLDLIRSGVVDYVSGTAFSVSKARSFELYENLDFYREHCVLRPMNITNHPEIIRRLGVISINTAIELDIYGHVNSTNVMGSRIMNGIGGSGDFTRNAHLSIFTTPSVAKGGDISSIVPMVSHVDHTEHDVDIIVTEWGLADLRGLSPRERAAQIIRRCAHPSYRGALLDYFNESKVGGAQHEPHMLDQALSWHQRFINTGSMKNKKSKR